MASYHHHANGGGRVREGVVVPGSVYIGPSATIHGGTIRGGMILGGEIHGGTILDGKIWGGTVHGGTIRGGVYRNDSYTPIGITDAGYFVSANYENGNWRIEAGCRNFPTIDAAIKHWSAPDYHTPRSGRRIVEALQALAAEESYR